jgi:hypothetical protein
MLSTTRGKLKWVIGYIDCYDTIHHRVIYENDEIQTHADAWPGKVAAHGKWRWMPSTPSDINTYGEDVDDINIMKIFDITESYTCK